MMKTDYCNNDLFSRVPFSRENRASIVDWSNIENVSYHLS